MANTIKVKRSATPSAVPTTGQLDLGEIAVNTYDGKLYIKKDNGTASIVEVGAGAGGGLTSLNSQTGATQTFAVGTSGTNFAVSSASNVHTFNLPDASATNRGALTSANWTTFNNKLGSLNSQTGATQTFAVGTAGTDFAVSSSADTHTFNLPSASASARGVVTTAAQTFAGAKTFSSDITVNGHRIGRGNNASAAASNCCVGSSALNALTSGTENSAFGLGSMQAITSGSKNTAYGFYSLYYAQTTNNATMLGYGTGFNVTGWDNTGVGYLSLYAVQGASGNTALGSLAGRYITGSYNTFVGTNCDATSASNGHDYCLGVGYGAICTGSNSIAIGRSASAAANCFDLRFGNAQRMVGDANGQFGINEASPGAQLQITSGSASRKGLIVKAAASATANIVEVQNSSGTVLAAFDSAGKLGIGTSAPSSIVAVASGDSTLRLEQYSANQNSAIINLLKSRNATVGSHTIVSDGDSVGAIQFWGSNGTSYDRAAAISSNIDAGPGSGGSDMPGRLVFWTTPDGGSLTERMRVTNGGFVFINTQSNFSADKLCLAFGSAENGLGIRDNNDTSGAYFAIFRNSANGICGSVTRVTTTNAVNYGTTSDYRLKDNVTPMADGLQRVLNLNPVQFEWVEGGEPAEGFIAHEVAGVLPQAVTGSKDEIDANGLPKYQTVDYGKLTPLLAAAIQELNAKVGALEARLLALETAR